MDCKLCKEKMKKTKMSFGKSKEKGNSKEKEDVYFCEHCGFVMKIAKLSFKQ